MDPRHPELAVSRIKELIKQYDRIEADMNKATTSAKLGQLEREGGLVVQEICLVAPRIHEAMMQTSRQRRHDLSRGILIEPQDTAVETPQGGMFESEIVEEEGVVVGPADQIIAVNEATTEEAEVAEKPAEKSLHRADVVINIENPYGEIAVHDAKPEEYIEKPKKKTTRKKKTTKKKEN